MEQDDNAIVRQCLNGNTELFSILIDKYQKPIFNIAYRMGYKKVYLIGCDGTVKGQNSHYTGHNDNCRDYSSCFREIQRRFNELEIINCSPISAYDFFEYKNLYKVVNE